ncbi:hypothetical protein TNCV_5040251 [Trichonephila clavipes]|nr:hypothetical protein TNCV_5040251 [Trichonephila clavipes]
MIIRNTNRSRKVCNDMEVCVAIQRVRPPQTIKHPVLYLLISQTCETMVRIYGVNHRPVSCPTMSEK